MPTEQRSPRLAVLVDADNASAKIADGLFEEIAKIEEATAIAYAQPLLSSRLRYSSRT
jgi:hypothetical protein